ncbi:LysR family transcriptional regulator [Brevibacterium luteolum]|uniref:LysR family transcriptional regulator n=1 Tax=Brevibacterium luteolum TaxID=199591 RepID=UPI003EED81CB
MNLRRLESFLAVVRCGTVTRAAQELHIAQPALSRQLKTLQRELRVDLFEPAGVGLQLTPAGQAFLPHARRLVQESQRVANTLSNIRLGSIGVLTVAATLASTRGFLAPFIATTSAEDPTLVVEVAGHYELIGLLAGNTDMAVTPETPTSAVESIELGRFPIWAHVGPQHRWAVQGRSEVAIDELAAEQLILPTAHSVSRRMLDMSAGERGIGVSPVHETDDGAAIQALAAAGRGVGVTTEFGFFDTRPVRVILPAAATAGTGKRITLTLPVHAVWRPGHYARTVIADIAERIRDFAHARPAMSGMD